MSKIAIFGGSFNPASDRQRAIAVALDENFDHVYIVPCGPRPDKRMTAEAVDSVHRAAMLDMTMRGVSGVTVDLFDLDSHEFTRTHDLQARYEYLGELWHVVEVRFIAGGSSGQSYIQKEWKHGDDLWGRLNFVVIERFAGEAREDDLPPNSIRIVVLESYDYDKSIREQIATDEPRWKFRVTHEVKEYIERFGLYQRAVPIRSTALTLTELKLIPFYDPWNEERIQPILRAYAPYLVYDPSEANGVLVIGGDGCVKRATRKYYRLRIPFIGINAGHLGFQLSREETIRALFEDHVGRGVPIRFTSHMLPMLDVEFELAEPDEEGRTTRRILVSNDAWLKHPYGQNAWMRVEIDGRVRHRCLEGDGCLISLPAGSTAYARNANQRPLLLTDDSLIICGLITRGWTSAVESIDSVIRIVSLENERRIVYGYGDDFEAGQVLSMTVRRSRSAAFELAFPFGHDMMGRMRQELWPDDDPVE